MDACGSSRRGKAGKCDARLTKLFADIAPEDASASRISSGKSHAQRLDDSFLVPRLEKALQAAKPPAVQVFANAAHSILLENFLCGLPRKDLRDHVVVWAADAETNRRMRSYLPSVRIVDVSRAFGSSEDAPFQSEAYAEFAAVKALMPHAAAALGFSTLTQDADVVWLADVPSYLKRFHAASMADSPRVDTRTRPCRRTVSYTHLTLPTTPYV